MLKKILISVLLLLDLLTYGIYWAFFDIDRLPKGKFLASSTSPDGTYFRFSYTKAATNTSPNLKANNLERTYLMKNKKKFIADIISVLSVVEEKNINNSNIDSNISKVKAERQAHYKIIKAVLNEANRKSILGLASNKDAYSFVSEKVQKILFPQPTQDTYTCYYKVEPADPKQTVIWNKKGYFYFVYCFTDSYTPNPADPYGDIKKMVLLLEKIKNKWIISDFSNNN